MSIAELIFRREGQNLLHLRLYRAETLLGSNPTSDVVVPDPSIPDVAALLIDRGGRQFLLRDLAPGRVTLNQEVADGRDLAIVDGDVIGLGAYELVLRLRRETPVIDEPTDPTRVIPGAARASPHAIMTWRGRRFRLSEDRAFNIGSDDTNTLVLEDDFVSGFHCRITWDEGRWIISDLSSTNGTLVNGMRVREAELPVPATIRLGRESLTFEVPEEAGHGAPGVHTQSREARASSHHGMIGDSARMRRVFDLIERFANAGEPVLVLGESGSGKELVARALHDASTRAERPYLALNCGAFSSALIESELFGHVKGAFTGAVADKEGAFEAADGGTLFLDEIGELPLELQPKLLRVLESRAVRRVGATKERPVSTRIVAATHRDLQELVEEGQLREDLFHRLFVLGIQVPPLRERPEDILVLARHFILTHAPTRKLRLDESAQLALVEHAWPGNVRELRNILVRAILMTDGDVLAARDLAFSKDAFSRSGRDARRTVRQLEETERERILEALEQTGGNRAEAARALGMSKSTFHDRIKRYGIGTK